MGTLQIQEHVSLAPFTTLRVGGTARFFARVRSERDVVEAVEFARLNALPLFALGGGSNLLVHDDEFPGVVAFLDIEGELVRATTEREISYVVPAGTSWDQFVQVTCENKLSGVECLAGIPGRTGGTPVQNVGAYGQEVSQTIRRVRAFDLQTQEFCELSNAECGFSYRSSVLNTQQRGRYLVTAVEFAFDPGATPRLSYRDLQEKFPDGAPSPLAVASAVRDIRLTKGMLLSSLNPDNDSVGSFFKNPIVPLELLDAILSGHDLDGGAMPHWPVSGTDAGGRRVKLAAAWLVEKAGFAKGFALGRAGISSRHSLAITNRGGATFADIVALRNLIQGEVLSRFGVSLEQEPVELSPWWKNNLLQRS